MIDAIRQSPPLRSSIVPAITRVITCERAHSHVTPAM